MCVYETASPEKFLSTDFCFVLMWIFTRTGTAAVNSGACPRDGARQKSKPTFRATTCDCYKSKRNHRWSKTKPEFPDLWSGRESPRQQPCQPLFLCGKCQSLV